MTWTPRGDRRLGREGATTIILANRLGTAPQSASNKLAQYKWPYTNRMS